MLGWYISWVLVEIVGVHQYFTNASPIVYRYFTEYIGRYIGLDIGRYIGRDIGRDISLYIGR